MNTFDRENSGELIIREFRASKIQDGFENRFDAVIDGEDECERKWDAKKLSSN